MNNYQLPPKNAMTTKLDTKTKLSTLWIVVMFNMAYADILSFYIPGKHEELAAFAGDTPVSQLMLAGAIVLEIPILMIFLSRILNYNANRWANIIAGISMIMFAVGPEIGNDSIDPHYIFIATVEILCMLLIIRTALKWPSPENA
ncbi:hypothetical protein DGMP_24270 [Desulfomarina profundi]|uniref:Uncharacterized protein n=1 Tax=Desulfomarina profundi TaxID=2772557 RepID=A0A8D5FU47_9BACT|nr:DUF6326 family protein [Desulfomarina profundi]BCL61734.1 hypothetical protein DGMP_24270 [Desulfomarina profundi]